MSDNNVNSVENKNNYNKDVMISQAIDKYCHEHNCSRGSLARDAIMEKLEKDGYIDGLTEQSEK